MLQIGPHKIDFPYVLAPMAGITDSVFRTLMKERGAGVVVSELVSCHGILHNSVKTFDLLVASLHQSIGEVLPTRLEYYEHWLSPMGRRRPCRSSGRTYRPRAAGS